MIWSKSCISLLRTEQWLKNLFVFLPMFCGGKLLAGEAWWSAIIVFLAFCLAASGVYCFNDSLDVEADRRHPVKKFRPVAAGKVSAAQARLLGCVLWVASLVVAAMAGWAVAGVVMAYCLLNGAYCLKLKELPIVDVFVVALGFVLRIVGGGEACAVPLSPWIVCLTFLLALLLALGKRRDDLVLKTEQNLVARKSVSRYNLAFINQMLTIDCAVIMVCYILYSVSPDVVARIGSNYLYVTSVFVLAGLMRYMQLTMVYNDSGSPTQMLMRDRFIQVCVVFWAVAFGLFVYL